MKTKDIAILGGLGAVGVLAYLNRDAIAGFFKSVAGTGAAISGAAGTIVNVASQGAAIPGDILTAITGGTQFNSELYKGAYQSGYNAGQNINNALKQATGYSAGDLLGAYQPSKGWFYDETKHQYYEVAYDRYGQKTVTYLGIGVSPPQPEFLGAGPNLDTSYQKGTTTNPANEGVQGRNDVPQSTIKDAFGNSYTINLPVPGSTPVSTNAQTNTAAFSNQTSSAALQGLKSSAQFNPSQGAYAWAQPGSPAYAEGIAKGIIKV